MNPLRTAVRSFRVGAELFHTAIKLNIPLGAVSTLHKREGEDARKAVLQILRERWMHKNSPIELGIPRVTLLPEVQVSQMPSMEQLNSRFRGWVNPAIGNARFLPIPVCSQIDRDRAGRLVRIGHLVAKGVGHDKILPLMHELHLRPALPEETLSAHERFPEANQGEQVIAMGAADETGNNVLYYWGQGSEAKISLFPARSPHFNYSACYAVTPLK